MVFDEIFSSLDRITARKIFARLFGNEGILRRSKTTTILSTHSSKVCHPTYFEELANLLQLSFYRRLITFS